MLVDKTVAVTGGASGVGAAIVREIRSQGGRAIVLDLHCDEAVDSVPVDLADADSVREAFARLSSNATALDGLVLSAGVQLHGRDSRIGDVDDETWEKTINVNLTGTFRATRAAIPLLIDAPCSSIVFIGSPTGLTMSGAGYAAYAASKGGMMSLARTVAADYASDGVRANVLVPGTLETPLTSALMEDPEVRADLVKGTPLGRLGTADDVAGLACWLLSDSASFATGGFYAVDGGLTAR